MSTLSLFDLLLASLLPLLALRLLVIDDLFTAVVLFIVFGVLMALTWSRLQAPDVALAEAAIGAGLTGVLLLATAGRLGTSQSGALGHRKKTPGTADDNHAN